MGFNEDLVTALPRLRRFSFSLCRNRPDADDLTQMTCERAITRQEARDPARPILPWLYTMARNLWTSEIRKRQVRLGAGHVPAEESPELLSRSGGEENTRASQVLRAVMALPEGMAETMLLVAVEGHSYAETAEILGIPPGTVMSRVSGARRKLRETLKGEAA